MTATCPRAARFFTALLCAALLTLFGCNVSAPPPPDHSQNLQPCCRYIDKAGKVVLVPRFAMTDGFDFAEGLSGVKNEKGLLGFINKSGDVVIPFQFQDGTSHSEGIAGVLKDGMCGFIDKSGKLIIPLRYDSVTNFHQGWGIGGKRGQFVVFVNAKGEQMQQHFLTVESFSEGLAAVAPLPSEQSAANAPVRHGFIDTTGKMVIAAIYEEAEPFSEGLAAVVLGGKWGYIDKKGEMTIAPQFELAGPFSEGFGQILLDKKMGYIDKNGKIVIAPQFEADQYQSDPDEKPEFIGQFVDGIAAVRHSLGAEAELGWGFIDTKGKFVVPPIYEDAYMFTEGLARVKKDGKWGFIDPGGKIVIPLKYSGAQSFSEGLALVRGQ